MSGMRFCVPVPCFFGQTDFCEALRKIRALGFDAAETYGWQSLDLEKVRHTCEETGVELLSMCTTRFDMTTPARRGEWLDGLRESCQAAKKLGVRRLITQVGKDTGEDRALQHQSIVQALTEAVPILEESGVTVMIEPLNTYVDHPGYYLYSSAEAFSMIREVGHPLVKMVFDIYHQQIMEGNIIPNLLSGLDCIAHLHAAGHPGRHELQFGENNYDVIFDAMDRAGYRGACGLEYFPTLEPEESLRSFSPLYRK